MAIGATPLPGVAQAAEQQSTRAGRTGGGTAAGDVALSRAPLDARRRVREEMRLRLGGSRAGLCGAVCGLGGAGRGAGAEAAFAALRASLAAQAASAATSAPAELWRWRLDEALEALRPEQCSGICERSPVV